MSGRAFSGPLHERHCCQPESDAEADQAGGDEMLDRVTTGPGTCKEGA